MRGNWPENHSWSKFQTLLSGLSRNSVLAGKLSEATENFGGYDVKRGEATMNVKSPKRQEQILKQMGW